MAAPDEQYVLLIGGDIGDMGPEGQLTLMYSDAELAEIKATTRTKLAAAGFEGTCALHLQWVEDA